MSSVDLEITEKKLPRRSSGALLHIDVLYGIIMPSKNRKWWVTSSCRLICGKVNIYWEK